MPQAGKNFYGWRIVFAGFVILATAFSVVSNLSGLFVTSLEQAIGVGRSEIALQYTLCTLACTVCCPFVGVLLQKVTLRVVMSLGILVEGLGLIAMAFSKDISLIYGIGIVMGIAQAGCTMLPVNMMIQNWFEKKRGLVTGLVLAGSGFGGFVFTQIITKSIILFGYERAYVIVGLCVLILCLPLTMFVVRLMPQEMGLKPYGAESSLKEETSEMENGMLLDDAKKTNIFKFFFVGSFLAALLYSAVSQHTPAYFTDRGYELEWISWINSALMLSLTVAKPIFGGCMDKKGPLFCITIGTALMFIGICYLLIPNIREGLVIFGICFGAGASLVTVTPAYLTASLFGRRDYAAIYGVITVAVAIGMAFGSPLAGFIFDKSGSYFLAWILCLVLLVLYWGLMRTITKEKMSPITKKRQWDTQYIIEE